MFCTQRPAWLIELIMVCFDSSLLWITLALLVPPHWYRWCDEWGAAGRTLVVQPAAYVINPCMNYCLSGVSPALFVPSRTQ